MGLAIIGGFCAAMAAQLCVDFFSKRPQWEMRGGRAYPIGDEELKKAEGVRSGNGCGACFSAGVVPFCLLGEYFLVAHVEQTTLAILLFVGAAIFGLTAFVFIVDGPGGRAAGVLLGLFAAGALTGGFWLSNEVGWIRIPSLGGQPSNSGDVHYNNNSPVKNGPTKPTAPDEPVDKDVTEADGKIAELESLRVRLLAKSERTATVLLDFKRELEDYRGKLSGRMVEIGVQVPTSSAAMADKRVSVFVATVRELLASVRGLSDHKAKLDENVFLADEKVAALKRRIALSSTGIPREMLAELDTLIREGESELDKAEQSFGVGQGVADQEINDWYAAGKPK